MAYIRLLAPEYKLLLIDASMYMYVNVRMCSDLQGITVKGYPWSHKQTLYLHALVYSFVVQQLPTQNNPHTHLSRCGVWSP